MKKIWILISVERGFIQEPEIFYSKNLAYKKKKSLKKELNPDYDEIELYEKYIQI